MTVAKGTGYLAKFGIYYFANDVGGSQAQPLMFAVKADPDGVDNDSDGDTDEFDEILTPNFINNINNMRTVTYSPLAEGLSTIGAYYSSPSSGASGGYCQNNFVIVVSPGISSEDLDSKPQYIPTSLADYDMDGGGIGEGNIKANTTTYTIPVNQNGSTYLDDVAYYLFANDIVGDAPDTGALCYDGLSGAFSVGQTVTGGTFGATGTITAVNENAGFPNTGCLELENISGNFIDDEALTSAGGTAVVNGELYDSGEGYQNILTYTIGFMGDLEGNLFLINTSNNGNGNKNLYDTSDEEYGKYHFTAQSPEALSEQLLAAVNDILSRTSTFTAPVVPVTRTTSGNRIYMAFFKPGDENFWEGNVTKFGLSDNNEIMDKENNPATWPNGAMRDGAKPYWATMDWADANGISNNYIHNQDRKIYTYLGSSLAISDLNHVSGVNLFLDTNTALTKAVMGRPTHSVADIINYVRGADAFDEDQDTYTTVNRAIITGDVLHSEPSIFTYSYADGSSTTMVYFGANDGMLHAVKDTSVDTGGTETSYGTEAWAFIPPDQLHRLKDMVESTEHQYYVDSTPKIFFDDKDKDGVIDTGDDRVILVCGERKGGSSYFALDVTNPLDPQYLWRISQYNDYISGTIELTSITGTWENVIYVDHISTDDPATGYLDGYVTPDSSTIGSIFRYHYKYAGHMLAAGDRIYAYKANGYVDGATAIIASISEDAPYSARPTRVVSQLGETWSEPQFGLVKTNSGVDTPVVFVGGGYSSDNSKGKTVLAINVITGQVVKEFTSGMSYSFPGTVSVIDENGDGYTDKVYAGDLGGQMWRFASFTNPDNGSTLTFPQCNEIIDHASYPWTGQVFFKTDENNSRKFFYPPSVTLEKGYDLVFMGTGDRENACCNNDTSACSSNEPDILCAVKDTHSSTAIIGERDISGTLYPKDLVDVTDELNTTPPNLNDDTGDVDGNGSVDKGWYIRLVDSSDDAVGEKVLAESTIFYKVFYITTFTPNDDPCMPGGESKLYALSYLTGAAAIDFDDNGTNDRSVIIGGGIPSKPVMVIRDSGTNLLISIGSTNPDEESEDVSAGVLVIDPVVPDVNFFYLWWRELFN